MGSEVFRFLTVRPPQEIADPRDVVADSVDLGLARTPFLESLRTLRRDGARTAMVAAATELTGSTAFLGVPERIDGPYRDFLAALATLPEATFWTAAGQAFTHAFGTTPAALVKTDGFANTYARGVDSLVAAAIDTAVPATARTLLVRLARSLWLIRRLAAGAVLTRAGFDSASLLLPTGILPLPDPPAGGVVDPPPAGAAAERQELHRRRAAELADELAAHRGAAEELLDALDAGLARSAGAGPGTGGEDGAPVHGFRLPAAAVAGLSGPTRALLESLGLAGGRLDVVRAVPLLERRATRLVQRLSAPEGAGPALVGTPGPCPPVPPPAADPAVTVPAGKGQARVLGIGDLMILEQELLRYELGEVAHIENVLRSETRSRSFKTSHTVEQSLTTEVETTQTKEQDLSSTERFELTTESQTVINDTAGKSLGLTIHASYGPSVDATSTVNLSSSSSRQQSAVSSATFAREVTTRAAQRIQTRSLTRRTTRTVDVVEETNEHGFDNKAGANDITGIYRFVDKVYKAQVVNYGKRLMLEFVVPEPAAFLRFARSAHPVDAVTVPRPDRPGNCVAGSFVPLQPEDITRDSYLFWAGKYGAADVTSPPAAMTVASATKTSPDSMPTLPEGSERKISSAAFDVPIPEGYLCQAATINIFGETQAGKHVVTYQVQNQQGSYIEPPDDLVTFALQPAPLLAVSINSIGFHNYEVIATVLCTVTAEKFRDWQFATFNSVMNAYAEQQSRYDQAVAEAKFAARDAAAFGTNPETNRRTEQLELKRGCISQLTGQRFDLFDAVTPEVAPLGFPETDFAEAAAEGDYIRAFEQSFEWTNLTYVFYPYFWGRKADWPTVAQLGDDDPLFAQFLQAGAARVQVPVRLGFEAGVLNYLATAVLWNADGTFVNPDGTVPDPVHVSVLDELRSRLGDNTVQGPGRISVTKNATAVTGAGTAFGDDDEDRRISIAGKVYVIASVLDGQNLKLATPYLGDSAAGLEYSLGGRLVGEPWEVRLPTDLVKLDNTLVIR